MQGQLARLRALTERFWVLPAFGVVLAVAAGALLPALDGHVTLPDSIAISGREDTAQAVLTTIVTIGVSVAGVSFSVIAVALVLTSQQLSPRVLRSFQGQALNQATLAALLGTATYALFVLASLSEEPGTPVPELSVTLAMLLATGSLALFVVFLDHVVRSLNASVVIRRIAAEGHESIARPYPAAAGAEPGDAHAAEAAAAEWDTSAECVEVRAPRAGYIATVDGAAIVDWAKANDAFVVQRRGVGSFAVTGAVLAVVHARDTVEVEPLAAAFLLNEERMVSSDVAFPIRQLADVALKGLSPGINDPSTAENAMDSITDTLVRVAQRDEVSALRLDAHGVPRLRAIAPTLDDLVRLGFDQVRRDAADRPSFAVRLLELLADLRESAPRARACSEIDRQAQMIVDDATEQVDNPVDQRMVLDTYARLHGHAAFARSEGGGLQGRL